MESEVTKFFLIQLKADCCVFVFRAEAIEHILKFAHKKKVENKKKKIKKVEDASKAALLPDLTTIKKKNQLLKICK